MEKAEAYALAGIGFARGLCEVFRPELTAKKGWLAIAGLVVAYELMAPEGELLSEGYDRLLEKHPLVGELPALAIAFHLTNRLGNVDPISLTVKALRHGIRAEA